MLNRHDGLCRFSPDKRASQKEARFVHALQAEIRKTIIGQDRLVERTLCRYSGSIGHAYSGTMYHLVKRVNTLGHRGIRTIITEQLESQPPPFRPVHPAELCAGTDVPGSFGPR